MPKSEKGFAVLGLLLIILLIAGIAGGVYLATHPTILKSHASTDSVPDNYTGLPHDKEIRDGKLFIHNTWVYLKTAWVTIVFGPTGSYGYSPCPTQDNNGIKIVPPECMTFGQENPEEYLQYPKLLKERGYNAIRLTAYWQFFDPNGEGRVTDQTAVDNLKRFIQAAKDQGMYIVLQTTLYNVEGGGVPDKFFDAHPDAQAEGFVLQDYIDQASGKAHAATSFPVGAKIKERDCENRTLDSGLNQHTTHPGWPDSDCDFTNRTGNTDKEKQYPRVPSIYSQDFKTARIGFIKDLYRSLGGDLVSSIIYSKLSVEPQYYNAFWLDYSDNAKQAFADYINQNNLTASGCSISNWNPPFSICQVKPSGVTNTDEITNPNSAWNIFRAKSLANYVNEEATVTRQAISDVLGNNEGNKALVGTDILCIHNDLSSGGEAITLGNEDVFVSSLEGINIVEPGESCVAGGGSTDKTVLKYASSKHWAVTANIDYDPDNGSVGLSYIQQTWNNGTNFELNYYNGRPVDGPTGPSSYYNLAAQMHFGSSATYPGTYLNGWSLYTKNWEVKDRFAQLSQITLTKGTKSGQFTPNNIQDFYPPNPNGPIPPQITEFNLASDTNGYYFTAKGIDNHLIDNYVLVAIASDADKTRASNYIFLGNFSTTIYTENQKHYFNIQNKLDPSKAYNFILGLIDYAGNNCGYDQADPAPFLQCSNNQGLKTNLVLTSLTGGISSEKIKGDFNNDGSVGTDDLVILLSHFGQNVPNNTLGDMDGDGKVDASDFVALYGLIK